MNLLRNKDFIILNIFGFIIAIGYFNNYDTILFLGILNFGIYFASKLLYLAEQILKTMEQRK